MSGATRAASGHHIRLGCGTKLVPTYLQSDISKVLLTISNEGISHYSCKGMKDGELTL